MQDFRILDGGAGSELQDLGFHVNVSIYLRKSDQGRIYVPGQIYRRQHTVQ